MKKQHIFLIAASVLVVGGITLYIFSADKAKVRAFTAQEREEVYNPF